MRLHAWLVLAAAAAASWASILAFRPPPVVPASAPPGDFSAERAFRHVEVIAREPHPRGSAANHAVRDYLVAELRALGLEAEIQRTEGRSDYSNTPIAIENIVARKPGTSGTGVLLVAHYDSRKLAPGAGDDAAGVAALLEALRAMKSDPPMRNDLIVLFSDAEEDGMVGASAFVLDHRGRIGVVFNFEGRGSAGPSLMFETSPGNRDLIRALAKVAPHVSATSLSAFVYRHLPNNTDFSRFLERRLPGMNFAFIERSENYHEPTDTPGNLDPRSVQQTGEYALGLARHYGSQVLDTEDALGPAGDSIYFNPFGFVFVHYPVVWGSLFTAALVLIAAAALFRARKSGAPITWQLLWPLGAMGLSSGIAAVAGLLLVIRVGGRTPSSEVEWRLAAGLSVAAAVVGICHGLLRRRASIAALVYARAILWTAVASILAVVLPEASYLFFWPAAVEWLAIAVNRTGAVARAAPAFVAIVIFSPLARALWIGMPLALPVISACVALLCWSLLIAADNDLNTEPRSTAFVRP